MCPLVTGSDIGPQLWVGDAPPAPERVEPIANRYGPVEKPLGGLWTSPLRPDGTSDWIEWMRSSGHVPYEDPQAWVLKPQDNVTVFEVNTREDVMLLVDGKPPTRMYLGRTDYDFESVLALCDGIHLTTDGLSATSGLEEPKLYGWDCESIVWDGWCFEAVDPLGPVAINRP